MSARAQTVRLSPAQHRTLSGLAKSYGLSEYAMLARVTDAGLASLVHGAGNDIDTREIVYGILTNEQRQRFENDLQLDFAYTVPGSARFRVNAYMQRAALSAAGGDPQPEAPGATRCPVSAPGRARPPLRRHAMRRTVR